MIQMLSAETQQTNMLLYILKKMLTKKWVTSYNYTLLSLIDLIVSHLLVVDVYLYIA